MSLFRSIGSASAKDKMAHKISFLHAMVARPAAAAGPYDAPPDRYAAAVNPVLAQVQSDLKVRRTACSGTPPSCRFSARDIAIQVAGAGRGTVRVTIAATFRDGSEAEATVLLQDSMLVLGSTMVAYDPAMPATRRVEAINMLGEAAFEDREAHLDSADVHYGLTFDDASGRLEIVVVPLALAHQ